MVHSFILENPSGCINNFPQKGRGLGHVTPEIFGIQSNISSKQLELGTSNLVYSFIWGMPSGRSNNFHEKGRGLGHVTTKIFGIQSNISSKLLELETSNLIHRFVWGTPSGRFFPQKGRGLGHITPQFLAYNRTYRQNCLSYRLQFWYSAFSVESRAGAQIIFPKRGMA